MNKKQKKKRGDEVFEIEREKKKKKESQHFGIRTTVFLIGSGMSSIPFASPPTSKVPFLFFHIFRQMFAFPRLAIRLFVV